MVPRAEHTAPTLGGSPRVLTYPTAGATPPRRHALPPPARRAARLTLGAALLLSPGRAAAFEHQWHAGASFGYASLFGADAPHGFGGGLHLAYGVNDTVNLLAEIDATAHPGAKYTVVSGGLGGAYVFD